MAAAEKLKISQNIWVENQPTELLLANDRLLFQDKEKGMRAAELLIAKMELAYRNEEKEKQALELISINNELRKAQEDIIRLNEDLEQKVTERTAELKAANKALEAFSYSASHDLRAPVRAVTSFVQIILQEYGAKMGPKLKDLFGYVLSNAKRMTAIIDDLLRLAKYRGGKLKLVPVDMTRMIQNVWSNISKGAPHRATLELAALPTVLADASMLEQVIMNLLSNAIKYSSKKAKPIVAIWCEQTKEMTTFYFKDNGAGFDMCNYYRLFGAFHRLHGMSDFEGTGVGLALVKSIIEKHSGTVGAEGVVGEGATFHFSLPVS